MTATEGKEPPPNGNRMWRRVLTVGVLIAVVAVVAVVAITNWDEYRRLLRDARLLPLLGALALAIFGHFLNTVIAYQSLQVDGSQIRLRSVYRINSVGGLAKFIPGGVWQIGSQYGMGKTEGLGFRHSMLAWVEPTAFNVTVGAGLACFAATTVDYGIPIPLLLAGGTFALVASTNPVRYWIYGLIRLIPPDQSPPSAIAGWPSRFGLTVVIIATTGLGGLLIINAFALPSPGLAGSVAAFVGSWVIGVLVFPIPGGLGVREGALVIALSPWMSGPEAVLVATAGRLVAIAAELLAATLGAAIRPSGLEWDRGQSRSSASTDG